MNFKHATTKLDWNCPNCGHEETGLVFDKKGVQCNYCNAHYEIDKSGNIRPFAYVNYAKFHSNQRIDM